jgi:GTP-binding protein EngB required for normal cell division
VKVFNLYNKLNDYKGQLNIWREKQKIKFLKFHEIINREEEMTLVDQIGDGFNKLIESEQTKVTRLSDPFITRRSQIGFPD